MAKLSKSHGPFSSVSKPKLKSVSPKENQPWIFIGWTDAEAEAPIFWPPAVKSWLIGKDLGTRKGWRQEGKGMTEDEMVGWHYQLNWYEFEQTLGDMEGQGNLACCSPWRGSIRHYWVTEQQQSCEAIDKLTKLIIVLIILQYIHISKHRIVHLKLRCYISTTA